MRMMLMLAVSITSTVVVADENSNTEVVATGQAIYSQTCIACHGADGKGAFAGIPSFSGADGPLLKTDEALKKNISEGFQTPGSLMAMPAKGGNPSLTEAGVEAVLAFLRAEFGT